MLAKARFLTFSTKIAQIVKMFAKAHFLTIWSIFAQNRQNARKSSLFDGFVTGAASSAKSCAVHAFASGSCDAIASRAGLLDSVFDKTAKMLVNSLFDGFIENTEIVKMLLKSLFDDFAENRQNARKLAF